MIKNVRGNKAFLVVGLIQFELVLPFFMLRLVEWILCISVSGIL